MAHYHDDILIHTVDVVKHLESLDRAGAQMYEVDHLSRQMNLPEATPFEVEQMREYKPTYSLPHPLSQFQSLVDYTECEQPVSGACKLEEHEP